MAVAGHSFNTEVGLYDVKGGERSNNYIDSLAPGETVTVHWAFVLQQRQVNLLNQQQHRVVSESIHTIQEKLKLTHHHLKHEIIQNALVTFLLELSNIWIENHWNLLDEPRLCPSRSQFCQFAARLIHVPARRRHTTRPREPHRRPSGPPLRHGFCNIPCQLRNSNRSEVSSFI